MSFCCEYVFGIVGWYGWMWFKGDVGFCECWNGYVDGVVDLCFGELSSIFGF